MSPDILELPDDWRVIPEFPDYEASAHGVVRRTVGGHSRTYVGRDVTPVNNKGYRQISVGDRTRGVHRLVASAFFGPCPEGLEVNHKDHNKAHNAVSNLEYVTHAENQRAAHAAGRYAREPRRFTNADIATMRELHRNGMSQSEVARRFACGSPFVNRVVNNKARRTP